MWIQKRGGGELLRSCDLSEGDFFMWIEIKGRRREAATFGISSFQCGLNVARIKGGRRILFCPLHYAVFQFKFVQVWRSRLVEKHNGFSMLEIGRLSLMWSRSYRAHFDLRHESYREQARIHLPWELGLLLVTYSWALHLLS